MKEAAVKQILDFLTDLQRHNDREWFQSNKGRYVEAHGAFCGFVEKLIGAVASFDPRIRSLNAGECMFRVYRNNRFRPGREPYDPSLRAYICPYGRNSGYAGYYFRIAPGSEISGEGSVLSAGVYRPSPAVMRRFRETVRECPERFVAAMERAPEFTLRRRDMLVRTPAGFPKDGPCRDYFRLRGISLFRPIDNEFLLAPDLLERALAQLESLRDFTSLMNRIVASARSGE